MIANVDPEKVLFLSVGLSDGSMEAFEDINEAVAHASELVERGGGERAVFVGVPRARVHMGVRVDPVTPAPMPVPQPHLSQSSVPDAPPTPAPMIVTQPSQLGEEWVRAQRLDAQRSDHDRLEVPWGTSQSNAA